MRAPAANDCPECGAALSPGLPRGLCSQCALRGALELGATARIAHEPLAGRRFGDYELIEEIARGGVGIVYRARQISLHRTVALKLLGAGMLATSAQLQRFEGEAAAVAGLDHPGIVPVYDFGQHEGQFFFSMKLVEGRSLAAHIRDGELALKPGDTASLRVAATRIARLMTQVAEAVHCAHQHGILHRDLKPGNILLDAAGQPHVTDFGLAKRVEADSTLTASDEIIGTPAYMAPEQAAGKMRKMTTASDVYSLGVVLYELLVGRPPFHGATVVETLRQIVDAEPVAPRAANPAVPRDLETICLKCLNKEPARRYGGAQELAEELGRFLRDEPITARPVSNTERLVRWCRRKPAIASLATVVVVLLLSVTAVSLHAARRATAARDAEERERRLAEIARTNELHLRLLAQQSLASATNEARKSREIRALLEEMLKSAGPSAALGMDTRLLQTMLADAAQNIGETLADEPEVEAELRSVLARIYHELGEHEKAVAMSREGLRLNLLVHSNDHPAVAHSMAQLGDGLRHLHQLTEAEPLLREGLAMQLKLGLTNSDAFAFMNDFGSLCEAQGRVEEAEQLYRQALAGQEALGEWKSTLPPMANLGGLCAHQARYYEALPLLTNAVKRATEVFGPRHPTTLTAMNQLAELYRNMDRHLEAEELQRKLMEGSQLVLGPEHPRTLNSINNLALALISLGRRDEAETNLVHVFRVRLQRFGPDHPDTLHARQNLAFLYFDQGRYDLAEPHFTNILIRGLGPEHPTTLIAGANLGELYRRTGRTLEAENLLTNVMAVAPRVFPPGDPALATTLGRLVALYQDQRRTNEIERACRQTVAGLSARCTNNPALLAPLLLRTADAVLNTGHPDQAEWFLREIIALEPRIARTNIHAAVNRLGVIKMNFGNPAEAVPLCRRYLTLSREIHGATNVYVADAMASLAAALRKSGELPEAEERAREALALYLQIAPDDLLDIANARGHLANILWDRGDAEGSERVHREALADARRLTQPEPWLLDQCLENLASVLADRGKLADAATLQGELVERRRKFLAVDEPELASALARLTVFQLDAGQLAEAERAARECLAIREQKLPDDWLTFNTRSLLGGALLGQKKFGEAEPELLRGYEGMKARANRKPPPASLRVRQAIPRLVRLYEATDQPAKAAEWKQKLAEYEKSAK